MYNNTKPSTDSFGPFLRTMRGTETSAPARPTESSGVLPTRVLESLAERSPQTARELLQATNMSILEIAEVLNKMRDLGLVEVEHRPGDTDEFIRLSQMGLRLVAQAR